MSIQTNFPAIKPTLLLDFANTKQLDSRITFTRASTATYYGTQTAKAEENLALQSQDFTTTWSSAENVSVTANTTTAPDGTATADTLAETAVTGIHTASQSSSSTGVLTFSVFAKPNSGTPFLTIGISSSGTSHSSATFDLSLGTNTQTQVNGGIYASPSATITAVAQGFYRCTFTVTTTDTAILFRVGLNNTGTPTSTNRSFGATYLGVVTNSIFVWGAQLEQRSAATAYTPTTTQAITNYVPQLLTAASGVARFDHNPTTFESLGLEIEESRTNLFTYSSEFDNAAWTKSRLTITANTVVAPDGALTGDKLVETTETGVHQVLQTVTCTSGVTYTYSCYVKAAERTFATITLASTAFSTTQILVNISAKSISTNSGTPVASSISDVGGGWLRVTVTQTATATGNGNGQTGVYNGTTSYTGDGYSGIYIWGSQLEEGAFPTSYIPTVASQVTRAADAPSMTGTNFSSWFNQSEGTLYAEGVSVDSISGTTARRFAEVNNGSTDNIMSIEFRNTNTSRFSVIVSNVSEASINSGGTINQFSKIVGSYKINDFNFCTNGTLGTQDTSGVIPVVTQLSIGNRSSNANAACINGTLKKIAYYPLQVTDAQLQGLTS